VYPASTDRSFVRGIPFQDAAKAGLQFGDEGEWKMQCMKMAHIFCADLDPEDEKALKAETKKKFKPLLTWLKSQAPGIVRDGSHRIVPSFSSFSDFSCNSCYL
jgi:heat shock protein 90kDa beta